MTHPINDVIWVDRKLLRSNGYNPNKQVDSALALLVRSIRESGWTQPIVVRPPNEEGIYVIVDGEHRWRASAMLTDVHGEKVPVVPLEASTEDCIAATVRHNRARGAHGVDSMVSLIARLKGEGVEDATIQKMLGIEGEEYARINTSEDQFLAIMSGSDGMMAP